MIDSRENAAENKPRVVEAMMVFDLDGVVTDPTSGTNEINHEVIAAIEDELRAHIPVAFNTGRAMPWVDEQIMPHLQSVNAEARSFLLVVAEKGGVTTEFDHNGQPVTFVDPTLSLPKDFAAAVQAALEVDRGGWRLSDYMFWDTDKRTMGSIEKLRDVPIPLDEFHERREVLLTELTELMRRHQLSDFKVDATIIATDIEHITAGKHKGAEQILAWLKRKRIAPKSFVTLGDSPSDAEMARVFGEETPTTFVYVGDPDKFTAPSDARYRSVIMNGRYSKDTLEHLVRLRRNREK